MRKLGVRLGKLGVLAVVIAIVIIAVAIFVNDTPQSPFANAAANATPTPAGHAEYVVRLADCVACHSVPGGKPFAGGLKMGTPLGAIYSTNITPDQNTGIGNYTLADFDNAVRRGVAKDGHRLYPAMPYPSYAKMSDEDVKALYDFFMQQVQPVDQANMASEIEAPYNMRWPLALWNVAFFVDEPFKPDPDHDAIWNRGAYLVQGPGHCGSCHTPRGFAFQEKALDDSDAIYLSGAPLDGWTATSLRGDPNDGLGRWTESDIVAFLKSGRNAHATVFGSMTDAFNNSTQFMSDDDLTAIARYLKSLPGRDMETEPVFVHDERTEEALAKGDLSAPGAGLYLKQCGYCHGRDGKGHGQFLPPLAGNPAVLAEDASSVINLMLNGASRIVANGIPDTYRMPPFRVLLKDQEIADIATFVRASWGNKAGPVTAAQVKALRESTDPTSDHVIVLKMR